MCLRVLVFSGDLINPVSLPQPGTGLVVVKRDAVFHALHVRIQHPGIIADSCFRAGLPAAADAFDLLPVFFQVLPDVDPFQHRFMRDGFMWEGERQENPQPAVSPVLVLAGAADLHIVISGFSPVCRQRCRNPFRPLRDHEKIAVAAFPHHGPGFRLLSN